MRRFAFSVSAEDGLFLVDFMLSFYDAHS